MYLIKVTSTPTKANERFSNPIIYYYGKDWSLVGMNNNGEHNDFFYGWAAKDKAYKRRSDAVKGAGAHERVAESEAERGSWTSVCEIIEYDGEVIH